MGLLDFFRGRRGRGAEGRESGDDPPGPSVRYAFAHRALPGVVFQNPAGFLAALSRPDPERSESLRDLWRQVREICPWDAAAAREATSFPVRPFLICGNCGMLIELPEPRRLAEAYFAAVAVRLPKSAAPPSSTPPPAWYFTLERGQEELLAIFPRLGPNRLVDALRGDPRRLTALLGETAFRGCFFRDLQEKLFPHLLQERKFHETFADLLKNPGRLVNDPPRLSAFLDEYDRLMEPASTFLCGWTAGGTHENYGVGPPPDARSFLAELAIWFTARSTPPGDVPDPAAARPPE